MAAVADEHENDSQRLRLLDQQNVRFSDREDVFDIEVRLIIAAVLSQYQGDGQAEGGCHYLRRPPPSANARNVEKCIRHCLVSMREETQVEDVVRSLRAELCNQHQSALGPDQQTDCLISPDSQILLVLNDPSSTGNCLSDLSPALLDHFQVVMCCDPSQSGSTVTMWSFRERIQPINNSLDHFRAIFQCIQSADKPPGIRDLIAVSATERQWKEKMRKDKHDLNRRYVHDLFVETALAQPSRQAIDAWDGAMTFEELNEISTSLATRLKKLGAGPEVVVPLLFEKSKWTVISMLAVLKAGGAFLFLDPAHPILRIKGIIDRVEARFSITSSALFSRLLPLERHLVVVEDILKSRVVRDLETPSSNSASSTENAAFLLFTSGSTGEPKGVVTEHQALASGIIAQAHGLGINSQSRVMQGSMFSFAAAIVEMLFTIVVGGCVCIPSHDERLNDFSGAFNRMGATFGIFPPSYTAIADPAEFKSLQVAVVGSEPLTEAAVQRWVHSFDVRHGYGTSEANTINAAASLSLGEGANLKNIGKGFAHNFWVVDVLNHDRLLRQGLVGEVLAEGPAIARGYLNDETATRKSFISAPRWYLEMYETVPVGAKFYKTGDLGRITTEGNVEILGRTDNLQVKLRGQRIELGEIEACSSKILAPGSSVYAELVLPTAQPRPYLALFYKVDASHSAEFTLTDDFIAPAVLPSGIRQHVRGMKAAFEKVWRETLPPFMRPSFVIPILTAPRTTTGKIGRKLLRDWASQYTVEELESYASDFNIRPPLAELQGEKEHKMAHVWSIVFDVPISQINVHSDFFTLGGDSLSAMVLAQKARNLGLEIGVADIINLHGFRDIAQAAEERDIFPAPLSIHDQQGSDRDSLFTVAAQRLAASPNELKCVLPTTDSQSRAIRLGVGDENCLVYHFVFSAKTNSKISTSHLTSALQALIHRYDSLRTGFFQNDDQTIYQAVFKHANIPIEFVFDPEAENGEPFIEQVTSSRIQLNSIPTKFWIIGPASDLTSKFVIRLSHAQFDGVSLPHLWRSLSLLYKARTLDMAPLFSDYIQIVMSADRDSAIRYFRGLLHDVPFTDVLHHRIDGHHPQNRLLRGTFTLPNLPFVPSVLFEAAWAHVLSRQTGNVAVVFDHIVSGRQLSSTSVRTMEVVGTCLNDVPVCVRFHPKMKVRDLLTQIQSEHLASAQHETLGFSTILEDCKPSHWPENARMTSSVQFRGFERVAELELGDTTCAIEMVERSMDLEDLTVLVEPVRGDIPWVYNVVFASSNVTCPEADAQLMFDLFSDAVNRFSVDIDANV